MKPFITTAFTRASLTRFYGLRTHLTTRLLCSSKSQRMFEDLEYTRNDYTHTYKINKCVCVYSRLAVGDQVVLCCLFLLQPINLWLIKLFSVLFFLLRKSMVT